MKRISRSAVAWAGFFAVIAATLIAAYIGTLAASAKTSKAFHTHWNILMPARGLYVGAPPPPCTDELANMMAYRPDKSLLICTGGKNGDGWLPFVVK